MNGLELHPVWVEAFVSVLGGSGVLIYLRTLARQGPRSMLESRQLWLLGFAGAFLLVRAGYWTTHHALFSRLTFACASAAAFLIFLYAEALLKRHMPLFAKLYALVGCGAFFLLSLAGGVDSRPDRLIGFGLYFCGLQAIVGYRYWRRPKGDLSEIENGFIHSVLIATVTSVPFFVTDILADLGRPVPRLGTLGALMFLYMFLRISTRRDTIWTALTDILYTIAASLGFAGMQALLMDRRDPMTVLLTFSLYCSAILLVRMLQKLRAAAARDKEQLFLRQLASADCGTLERFAESLSEGALVTRLRVVREREIASYDVSLIAPVFDDAGSAILTLAYLRRKVARRKDRDLFALEQLTDLLERNGMSHLVLIRRAPLVLLLAEAPQAGRERAALLELGVIRRLAELIEHRGPRRSEGLTVELAEASFSYE